MDLFRDVTAYSRALQAEKEHDWMTGLYNKGKLLEMKRSLFSRQETIAVFNMDLNNLKLTNDTLGHEAGDLLIKKAAKSLRLIEARNIIPFRVGGDEFLVIAIHVDRQGAEWIRTRWENALEKVNREDGGEPCVVACGFAFGEKGFDLDEVFALADRRMYEDKKAKKMDAGQPPER
jgi:diguanylate cyclase (GGDEF)-like protein